MTPSPSTTVAAPCFAEAELVIECRKMYWQDMTPANFLDATIAKMALGYSHSGAGPGDPIGPDQDAEVTDWPDPGYPAITEKDKLLAALIDSLCRAPQALTEPITNDDGTSEDKPLRVSDWIAALEAVEDSVWFHKGPSAGVAVLVWARGPVRAFAR